MKTLESHLKRPGTSLPGRRPVRRRMRCHVDPPHSSYSVVFVPHTVLILHRGNFKPLSHASIHHQTRAYPSLRESPGSCQQHMSHSNTWHTSICTCFLIDHPSWIVFYKRNKTQRCEISVDLMSLSNSCI